MALLRSDTDTPNCCSEDMDEEMPCPCCGVKAECPCTFSPYGEGRYRCAAHDEVL